VVICLQRGADCLHMVQLMMPLHPQTQSSLASFKSRLVLPIRYRLTRLSCGKEAIERVWLVCIIVRKLLYVKLFCVSGLFAKELRMNARVCLCTISQTVYCYF